MYCHPRGHSTTVAPTNAPVAPTNAASPEPSDEPAVALTAQNAVEVWNRVLARLSGMVVDQAKQFDSIAFPAPNRLVIRSSPCMISRRCHCERPEQIARFEKTLAEVTGQPIRVEFALTADEPGEPSSSAAAARVVSPHQRRLEVMQDPLVQSGGRVVRRPSG